LIGGIGDDEIVTGNGNDTIDPGMGHDQVYAGEGSDGAIATSVPDGPDLYDLGPGFYNWLTYQARSAPVIFRAESPDEVGAVGEGDSVRHVTSITGGSGDDILVANAEAKYFLGGGPGNDQLVGGSQNDTLVGGRGNDRYEGGEGDDEITEGVANHAPQLDGENEENYADGGTGNDIIALNAGPDRALGGPGNDTIRMGAGPDVATGGPGDDTILGDDGNDWIDGEEGDDRLVGARGSDQLNGGSGDDRIVAAIDYRGKNELELTSLTPLGAVDGWADSIDCGEGTDSVSLNPWDTAQQCERRILVQALQIGGTKINRRTRITWLRVGVRSGGTLKLRGGGVRGVTERPKHKAGGLWLPIRPRGHALSKLQNTGKVSLRLRLTFRPVEGIARSRLHWIRLG
jgi:Ca2+-binding RTX toxin-like protein